MDWLPHTLAFPAVVAVASLALPAWGRRGLLTEPLAPDRRDEARGERRGAQPRHSGPA